MDSRSPEENSLLEFLHSGKRILIITGEVNSGKTSTVEKLIILLLYAGKKVGGVFSKGVLIETEKTGFNVIDIKSNSKKQLASIYPNNNFTLKQGRYYFDPDVFIEFNTKIINSNESDIIVIDEIGHLELYDEGFFPSIEFLISELSCKLIFVIRKDLLERILYKFRLSASQVQIMEIN